MPYDYHISTDIGEKVRIAERGPNAEFIIMEKLLSVVLPQSLIFLGFFFLGFFVHVGMMFVILAFIPILALVSVTVGKSAHEKQKAANDIWDAAFGRFSDALTNVRVVRSFIREEFESEKIGDMNRIAIGHQFSINKLWGILESGRQFLDFLVKIAVMTVGTYWVMHQTLTIGELFLFVALSGRFYGPLQSIEAAYREIVRKLADVRKSEALLVAPSEPDNGTRPFPGIRSSIRLDAVSFAYPSAGREVLKGVSLEIPKGSRVALVGHTGSGKSTIANLLLRFYEPSNGRVTIDGTDVREFSLASYRRKFAAVFQDTTLFNDTLRSNLEYVRDDVPFEEIREACRKAEILDFIESLPEGFETMVGERGLKLSGGEKQRLSIARAILADPEILILDEATSALDSKTEKRVQAAFSRLMEGRTSVVIAHRLSTVVDSDMIAVIDHGSVIATGTHGELLKKDGIYRELVETQRGGMFCEGASEENR